MFARIAKRWCPLIMRASGAKSVTLHAFQFFILNPVMGSG
jgi:hypothetical protein